MNWSYRCLGWIEPILERLPRLLSRPLSSLMVFVYFHWKVLLVVALIAFSSGTLAVMLWDGLPRGESLPALLLLTMLSLFALWQWAEASHLRQRLYSREEEIEYEHPRDDMVEN